MEEGGKTQSIKSQFHLRYCKKTKKTSVQMFYANTLMHFILNLDMSNESFKDIKKIHV